MGSRLLLNHDASDKILLKSRKLIDKAQRAPLKYLDELALHLSRESDLETVARALLAFDPSSISADHLRDYGPPPPEHKAYVTRSMADFGVIVQSLHKARKRGNVQAFSDSAMPLIFEHWENLIKWLTYMLSQVSSDGRTTVSTMCCELLRGATDGASDDPYREELAVQNCTIDLIFLLLCQMDDKGSYVYIPQRADRACAILYLFRAYFEHPTMCEAIDERLHSRNPRIRTAILQSLVRRTRNIVERATTRLEVVGCIKSLSCILHGIDVFMTDPALWKILYREDFLREFTAALQALVINGTAWNMPQDEFVRRAVLTCFYVVCHSSAFAPGSPRSSVMELMNAGFISCARISLSRILAPHTEYAKRFLSAFTNVLPYLFTPRVLHAIGTPWSPYDIQLPEEEQPSEWHGCGDALLWVKTVWLLDARRDKFVSLCSNLQHLTKITPHNPGQAEEAHMKECQRCHSVMYCSAECQEMDWPMHSKECRSLAEIYRLEKEFGTWVSAQGKADYLTMLETVTSFLMPSPTDLLTREISGVPTASPPQPPPLKFREDFSVTMIDFYAHEETFFPVDRLSMKGLMTSSWRCEGIQPWLSRLQRFIQSIEAEMEQLIIVEGYFRVNETGKALMVTALTKYHTDLPKEEKYQVVNSFFSVVNRGYHK